MSLRLLQSKGGSQFSYGLNMEDIRDLFSKFGKVERIVRLPYGEDKYFVTMRSILEAYHAYRVLKSRSFCNGKVELEI